MAKKLAFLYPGQGSQYPGMGLEIYESYPEAREVFSRADEVLGIALSKLCFEGPEEDLKRTSITQPAILTVSVAVHKVLSKEGVRPDYVTGHSLGEYSALVSAGALQFKDAVRLVHLRGRFMQEAVPEGKGAMAAVIGLAPEEVTKICEEFREDGVVSPANYNSKEQTVIAGEKKLVEKAARKAEEAGAVKVVFLPVSAPFHCALMKPAEEELAVEIAGVPFSDLECPLVTNVDAVPITRGEEARDALIRQVCNPVRWVDSIEFLSGQGVEVGLEVGPGKVLSGLTRRINRGIENFSTSNEKSLKKFLEHGNK